MRAAVIAVLAFGTLAAAAPRVAITPQVLVLGRDPAADVVVSAAGPGELRAFTNVGTLTAVPANAHERRFRYEPPSTRHPDVALLLFWLEDGQRPELTVSRLPLLGRTDLEAVTEPGATVRVQVASTLFGPVQADGRGRVAVPIEVPPGITSATVLAESRGKSTRRDVPLDVPKTNPLAAVFTPERIELPGHGWLVVASAAPMDAAKLVLRVEGGRAELDSADADRALFRVAPAKAATEVAVKVTLPEVAEAIASARAGVEPEIELPPPPLPPPPPQPVVATADLGGAAGFFYAGGANFGWAFAIAGAYPFDSSGRFALEGSVGLRTSSMSEVTELGTLDSAVLAVPIGLGLRMRLLERGPRALYGRAGGGLVPFRHGVSREDGRGSFTESALGWEGYAALQGTLRAGSAELFAELRGTIAPMRTAHLVAQGGGTSLFAGARWRLP